MRGAAALFPGLLFAAVFLLFDYKIAARYLAHNEPAWTDEACVILFIWIVFSANALLLGDREQIRFDLLLSPSGPRTRRVMGLCRHALIGGLFLWCLPGALDYLLFLWRERTPVLQLRFDWVYACFILFMGSVIARAGYGTVQLLRPGWRSNV